MADLYLSVGAGDAGGGNNHGAHCYGSAWESGTNTGGNYSTVSWAISADYYCNSGWTWGGSSRPSAGYLDMVINGSVVGTMTLPINNGWGNGTGIGSQSGSLNIGHNADGTGSFSFYIRVRTGDDPRGGGVVYNSGSSNTAWKGLSTIPRASQPSTSTNSPTAGVAFTVYTNRKSSSFSHTIYYEIRYGGNNGTHVQAASNVGDSASITVPESVFDSAGNYSSLACRILCDTYSGSTKIGDTKYTDTILYTNDDMKPTISSAGLSETNNRVSSKRSDITVRYLSRKTVTCKIGTKHGASVSSVTVANGNLTVSMSNSNGTWTSNSMTNLQTGTYLITVIDSRGMKATQQINQTYYAYAYPSVTGSANRSSSTGSNGTVNIAGTYWGGLSNTASITYQRNTESSSHALSATPSNGKISGSVSYSDLDYQTAYSWDVTITDGFGETARGVVTLPQAMPALFIGKNSIWTNSMRVGGSCNPNDTTVDSFLTFIKNNPACNGSVHLPSGSKIAGVDIGNTWWHFYTLVHRIGGPYGDNAEYIYLHLQSMTSNQFITRDFKEISGTWSVEVPGYPIGSIYTSTNSTSPATLFGGTWQEITGRFLLAHDSSHPAASTGGEYSHTLIREEIPNYVIGNVPMPVPPNHTNWNNGGIIGSSLGSASSSKVGIYNRDGWQNLTSGTQYSYQISSNGAGRSHNNTPPYLSVYMWKRTG